MTRSRTVQAGTETEDFMSLERHFPFAGLMLAVFAASQVASTVLMLISQR